MAACDAQDLGRIGATAEQRAHVGVAENDRKPRAHVGVAEGKPARAKQGVPPAVRRRVLRRDGRRCVVPGCRHSTFLDLHHLELRSEGGDHDPDSLVVLCGAHHRALHRGQLSIEGKVSKGLVFRHAGGAVYGSRAVEPQDVQVCSQVFTALRQLGFRESDARRALERVMKEPTLHAATDTGAVLRSAVRVLTG